MQEDVEDIETLDLPEENGILLIGQIWTVVFIPKLLKCHTASIAITQCSLFRHPGN
jgi:hypothetical protein